MWKALINLIVFGVAAVFASTVTQLETTTEIQTATSSPVTIETKVETTSEIPPSSTQASTTLQYTHFQVSLHYSYNDDFICSGSIISSKIVLTSAHCMYYRWGGLMPPIIVRVAVGKQQLNDTPWMTYDVVNITLHPLFNKTSMENDLALIEIEGKFEMDNIAGEIDLMKQIQEPQYNSCKVTGWNQDTFEFQVVEVTVIDCLNYPDQICTKTKYQNNDQCIDNAGNPLICDDKLAGVLSVEPNCEDPEQLSLFENVRQSVTWINENVSSSASKISFEYVFKLLLLYKLLKTIL